LLYYMRRVRGRYVFGVLLTLGYAVFFQFVPLSVRDVVSRLSAGHGREEVMEGVLLLLGVAVAFALLRLFSQIALFEAARQIEYELRNDLFAHLQRLPQSFFAVHRTGDLMSRAVNDINSVRLALGMGLRNLIQTPVIYVGAFGAMALLDWRLALCVALPYPLFIAIGRVFGRRLHVANLEAQEQLGALSTAVQENAAGVLVVRAYAMEDEERARFRRENERLYRRGTRLARVNTTLQPVVGLLPGFAMILVLFVGGARVRSGELSVADLWAFYMYIFMLTFPTFMLGWVFAIAQRGLAALGRLGEVLDTVPSIRDRSGDARVERIGGSVEFRGLDFRYGDTARGPALSGISLRIEQGETVGVVGSVGAGKSTLVALVPRLLEVPDGALFVGGVDVNAIPLRALRSGIAMVPQESFLFSTTVAENVRFGKPDASLAEVREAAGRAHVLQEIEELPQGFDTPVGERGITLSGGQRQRIALARALLLDPAILILDDALSSVDTATEEAILKELKSARAGRTCFIVAHRLSAVRDADRIVVLENGAVAEEGTHDELVRRGAVYARIHRQQQLEAELEAGA
jgi:ATP-binding cassette subfamily B protein